MLNLDTHILLDLIPGKLSAGERKVLNSDSAWSISAIVLWEIEILYERKRIPHGLDHPLLAALLKHVQVLPLSVDVCLKLRMLDFKSDPADELIAATSLAHGIPLVTRDRRIRASKLVRCV